MKNKVTSDSSNPTVNLAINKSRIKKYGKNKSIPTYYLKKGQEFQIELYNPTQGKVLAEIKLNGKVNGGLILRAGERIFLDRYLDSKNKFLFDTYHVDDEETTKKAIELNGDLEVKFFKENELSYNYWGGINNHQLGNYNITIGVPQPYITANNSGNLTILDNNQRVGIGTTTSNEAMRFSSNGNIGIGLNSPTEKLDVQGDVSNSYTFSSNIVETGIVDKGSKSKQDLEYATGDFNICSFHSVEYKLLPISQKKTTTSEYYKKYCGNCGAKCKTKFCSQCGAKQ